MTLAVTALVLPALVVSTSGVNEAEISKLSIAAAVILAVVYVLSLVFSLKTHSYLYDVGVVDLQEEGAEAPHKPNLWLWLGVLVVSTIAVAFEPRLAWGYRRCLQV
jgi:Ca2+:H+ antiporter